MKHRPTTQEQSKLALDIIRHLGSDWLDFVRNWMGFNAFYNAFGGSTERIRLMESITAGLTEEQAINVLHNSEIEIAYFKHLPPGDSRRHSTDPNFRARATADMAEVFNPDRSPHEKLAYLIATVYQVRCNLIHGTKNPRILRDRELVKASNRIMKRVVACLMKNADPHSASAS